MRLDGQLGRQEATREAARAAQCQHLLEMLGNESEENEIKKQLHKIANYYDVLSKENARLNDLIDEYIQERDYLDARCAALE